MGDAFAHVVLGEDHMVDAEAFEDLAVLAADGLGPDVGHAGVQQVGGDQDAGLHVGSDTDDRAGEVVDAELVQDFRIRAVGDLVKTVAPQVATGVALGQSHVRSKYGVTVVGIKRPGEDFTYATADTVVQAGDVIVVTGKTRAVETFANLS
ncbi:hypothetical protein GCM10010330_35980 [Streptomyces tendae]|nr:hypothetical protein GCM10010330_35980 [Streptomyces tendae]